MIRALLFCLLACPAFAQQPTTWRFNSLTHLGGHPVTLVGQPRLVDTNLGKAIHFNGYGDHGDALFVDGLPLLGTVPYTLEVVFRPASGGAEAQRFFHMQQAGSEARRMFELRIVNNRWCLDTVAFTQPAGQAARSGVMLNCDAHHLFPLDKWYAIAAVYDGKVLRAYVDGVLQGEVAVQLEPLTGQGGVSAGARYNKVFFFKGDIFEARFTDKALPTSQLMKVPDSK